MFFFIPVHSSAGSGYLSVKNSTWNCSILDFTISGFQPWDLFSCRIKHNRKKPTVSIAETFLKPIGLFLKISLPDVHATRFGAVVIFFNVCRVVPILKRYRVVAANAMIFVTTPHMLHPHVFFNPSISDLFGFQKYFFLANMTDPFFRLLSGMFLDPSFLFSIFTTLTLVLFRFNRWSLARTGYGAIFSVFQQLPQFTNQFVCLLFFFTLWFHLKIRPP